MTAETKDVFRRALEQIESALRSGVSGYEVAAGYSDAVDELLADLFRQAMTGSERDSRGVALVALGGYGRRELTPGSDLDLMLLHRGWTDQAIAELNRKLMYPLWDANRELGNRVRTPREVVRSLDKVEEATAVLEARYLAGDHGLFAELESSVVRSLERGRSTLFRKLHESIHERHERYGRAGHLLEPDVRDAAGGLRDMHTLRWAGRVLRGGRGLDGLVAAGYLSEVDRGTLADAYAFLLRARIELHLHTGRRQDRMYVADQDGIAERLGFSATDGRAAGDVFMQELYARARDTEAIVLSVWERLTHQRGRFLRRTAPEQVGDGCVVQDGRLEAVAVTALHEDPAGWLRVFRRAIREDVAIGRATLNRLHASIATSGPPAWTPSAREVFEEIVQSGWDGVRSLEALDSCGLLSALMPEWTGVRCLPQRDVYHRFTVDMHLFATIGELAESRVSEEPATRDAWSRVGRPSVVFLAALLHDIGKGRGGDHSAIGEVLALEAARRMGMSEPDASDVSAFVREHLALAELATRRDVGDPRTVEEAARRSGDTERLAMMFLLTRADARATGPEAWSSFRAALVRELYMRVLQHLEGEAPVTDDHGRRVADVAAELHRPPGEVERLVAGMPSSWLTSTDPAAGARQLMLLEKPLDPGEIRTAVGTVGELDEFVLVTRDRPGLFATVAGVLAVRGVDVHAAEIFTRDDGTALEVFRVLGAHGAIPDDRWRKIREDVEAALAGRLDLDEALAKRAAQTHRRRAVRAARGPSRVVVDNAASETHTVVEIHTRDRVGLLRTITKALAEGGCDLSIAKVATYGAEVVDVFYLLDLDGRRITSDERIADIERRLLRALGEL